MNIADIMASAPEFDCDKNGAIIRDSQRNIALALSSMGAALRYNSFAYREEYSIDNGPWLLVDDPVVNQLWLTVDGRFKFRPTKDFFIAVARNMARKNAFHPVRNYLDRLKWDGTPRIDTWLVTYAGADDNPYVRAVAALVLIAAVRRVRKPGAKFDEMLVLESGQGVASKSSALAALCPDDSWFSDDLPLHVGTKEILERTEGKWLIEASELSGMRRSAVEHLKAMLSRRCDRARMSYDRWSSERPRQFIMVGTTNAEAYLRDATGERRYWPVKVKAFDIEALIRDRDQLWAEAAARELSGVSIRLAKNLWPVAGREQERRRIHDPWRDLLGETFGSATGKVLTEDVWALVGMRDATNRTQEHNTRLGAAMTALGFARALRRHEGKVRWHYVKGATAEERAKPLKINWGVYDKKGAGSDDKGAGSDDKGAGSDDKGAGSDDKGAGSDDKGAGSDDKGVNAVNAAKADWGGSGSDDKGVKVVKALGTL